MGSDIPVDRPLVLDRASREEPVQQFPVFVFRAEPRWGTGVGKALREYGPVGRVERILTLVDRGAGGEREKVREIAANSRHQLHSVEMRRDRHMNMHPEDVLRADDATCLLYTSP